MNEIDDLGRRIQAAADKYGINLQAELRRRRLEQIGLEIELFARAMSEFSRRTHSATYALIQIGRDLRKIREIEKTFAGASS